MTPSKIPESGMADTLPKKRECTLCQIYSSKVLHGNHYRPDHHAHFKKAYNVIDYHDPSQPAIFYGCYDKIDYRVISQHTAGGIVIWAGSDVLNMKRNRFKFKPNIRHISLSKQNQAELKKYNITSEHKILLKPDHNEYKLKPLGEKIYVYMPYKRRRFYGYDTIRAISKKIDVEWILARFGNNNTGIRNATPCDLMSQYELRKIYSDTLCCIRPTKHDGFPQTFLELGLMGRRGAWPHESGIPVKCKTINSYIQFIRNEQARKRPHSDIRETIINMGDKSFLEWF